METQGFSPIGNVAELMATDGPPTKKKAAATVNNQKVSRAIATIGGGPLTPKGQ